MFVITVFVKIADIQFEKHLKSRCSAIFQIEFQLFCTNTVITNMVSGLYETCSLLFETLLEGLKTRCGEHQVYMTHD